MVQPHDEILFGCKQEQNTKPATTFLRMDPRGYAKWKGAGTKDHTLCHSISPKCLEKASLRRRKAGPLGVTRGRGVREDWATEVQGAFWVVGIPVENLVV